MRKISKLLMLIGIIAALFLSGADDTSAAIDEAYVSAIHTTEKQVYAYVKNVNEAKSVRMQIGTEICEKASVKKLSECSNIGMDTLILIDNSLSISQANRKKTQDLLKNIIEHHAEGERFSVMTFAETLGDVHFTTDYQSWIQVIDGIEYRDQDTYLIDVLYRAVEVLTNQENMNYKRIIVVSDGVDDNNRGYTKDELHRLIQENMLPIYGIASMWKSKEDGIETMFELSRTAKSPYFLLDDYTDSFNEIVEQISKDYTAYVAVGTIPDKLKDGETRNMKLTLKNSDGNITVEAKATLPFAEVKEAVVEKKETPTSTPTPKPTAAPSAAPEPEKIKNTFPIGMIFAGGIAGILVLAVIISFILEKKKEKKKNPGDSLEFKLDDVDETEFLKKDDVSDETADETVLIWDVSKDLKFTDLKNNKTFVYNLKDQMVLGRKEDLCDIAFSYDKNVSGKHCKITLTDGELILEDLNSSNGTWINDRKVTGKEVLHSGDEMKLGKLVLKVDVI